jgi:hypothetical protein
MKYKLLARCSERGVSQSRSTTCLGFTKIANRVYSPTWFIRNTMLSSKHWAKTKAISRAYQPPPPPSPPPQVIQDSVRHGVCYVDSVFLMVLPHILSLFLIDVNCIKLFILHILIDYGPSLRNMLVNPVTPLSNLSNLRWRRAWCLLDLCTNNALPHISSTFHIDVNGIKLFLLLILVE